MKYLIITIHCIPNFGSVFQSYALTKFLNTQGYETSIIDYRPTYYSRGRNVVRKYGSILLNLFPYLKQKRNFDSFIRKNIPLTKPTLYTIDDLKKLPVEGVVYISGGDQLWNSFHPSGRDDAYKLTFISGVKKLAIGTSMGRTSFSDEELRELSSKVKDFSFIGLREQSTVELLKPYLSTPVNHVVDPVLLLRKNDYLKLCGDKPYIKDPYLLMYMTAKSEKLNKTVEYVSKKLGLKIVHVSGFSKKCKCNYFLKSIGPETLLNLIVHARFVISSSFHATLFSILFEKQFCSFLPESGTNTRIEDLLSFYGLSNRIIHDASEVKRTDSLIDYTQVTNTVEHFSEQSRQMIISAISSKKHEHTLSNVGMFPETI